MEEPPAPVEVVVVEEIQANEPEPEIEAVEAVEVKVDVQQAEEHPTQPSAPPPTQAAQPPTRSRPGSQKVKEVKPYIFNEAGKVVELSEETFNRETTTGAWFIEFYAP